MSAGRQIVKQLDHLVVRVDNPQPLFKLLSETLQLPVAWPLQAYPSFTSGGVCLGNLYLEVLSSASRRELSSSSGDARFVAIAFESDSLKQSVGELDSRHLAHGPIVPYKQVEPDGSRTEIYSNVILGKLLGSNFWIDSMITMSRLPGSSAMADPGTGNWLTRWGIKKVMSGNLVFIVRYAYENMVSIPQWSEYKSHDEKRAADKRALAARGGGPLGLESVKKIVAGVKDVEGAEGRWRQFLAPLGRSDSGVWEIADGPGVRLVASSENAIKALVLKVSSLKEAETFMAEKGMLGVLKSGEISIAPDRIYGLDVRLAE